MPPVAAYIAAYAASFTLSSFIIGTLISMATSFVLGKLEALIVGKPSAQGIPNGGVTTQTKQPITSRKPVYGDMRISGPLLFASSSDASSMTPPAGVAPNKFLHLIIGLAPHELQEIGEVWIDDYCIPPDAIDADTGIVNTGRFKDWLRIRKHLGATDQTVDTFLQGDVDIWDESHTLSGIAYIYLTLDYNPSIYPTGIPNISAFVKGKKILDTRTSTTAYSTNVALMVNDYIKDSVYGLGATAAEIDTTFLNAAANICDEFVTTTDIAVPVTSVNDQAIITSDVVNVTASLDKINLEGYSLGIATGDAIVFATTGTLPAPLVVGVTYYVILSSGGSGTPIKVATSNANALAGTAIDLTTNGTGTQSITVTKTATVTNILTMNGEHLELQTGDRVQATTTGVLPAGLALLTNYYVITYQRKTKTRIKLASSYANALAGTEISITDGGSGTHTITKNAEPRYSGAIQIDSDSAVQDNINYILTGMSGSLSYSGGSYRIIAGAYATPTVYFDESDFAGAITVQTKISRRERFNSVHGLYLSPLNDGQPADYPPVKNSTYIAADGLEIIQQIDFPATPRPHTAQRLAKIEVEEAHQEITFSADFNLSGMLVQVGDTAYFTVARFGWTNKIFKISDWKLDVRDQDGVPLPVVNMTLRETSSAVYDWNNGEETKVDTAPNTTLPDPFTVGLPGAPQVVESLYSARDGGGVKTKAVITSVASTDAFVTQYQFRYKLLTDDDYITRAISSESTDTIFDIPPGEYTFEARAINILGGVSDWVVNSPVEIIGLSAAPSAPTGLTIQAISSFAMLRWDQSVDLDVTEGGQILFRHSPALDGSADWSTSVSIGDALPGRATDTTLPLKAGTYLMRFYDSSGTPSTVVQVITNGAIVAALSVVTSLTENPTFTGVKTSVAMDNGFSPAIIKLTGAGLFDDIPSLDAVGDMDSYGGLVTMGTYDYSTYIDLTTVQTCRLESHIKARVISVLDLFDDRTSDIDDWTSFDGDNDGDGDCTIWIAETGDNPAGAPTWSDWQRLDVGEYHNRAFKFQARLTTADPIYNIYVEELSISVKQ